MSQPPGTPASSMSLRGAVDLAAVAAAAKRREKAASGQPSEAGAASGLVVEATEETFQSVVEISLTVPVVVDLYADYSEQSKQLSPVLERLATEYGGRFLLVRVDIEANPRLAQVFQAQAVPSVVAVVKGQPVPLFQGALPQDEVTAYLDELLRLAEANGVTGTVPGASGSAAGEGAEAGAGAGAQLPPEEPPLPPLHQEAYDAIERGDLDAAAAAYEKAVLQSPADTEAKAGLAQVNLLRRTEGVDPQAARAVAASAPQDPQAQIVAADLDVLGGHVEDAFARLVDTVRVTIGDERNAVREHLVELFEIVGTTDPRVVTARRALSAALY